MRHVSAHDPGDLSADIKETANVSMFGPSFADKRNFVQFEIGPCTITYRYIPKDRKCVSDTNDIDTGDVVASRVFSNIDQTDWTNLVNQLSHTKKI